MKKIFIYLVLSNLTLISFSQYTLRSSDVRFKNGTIIDYYTSKQKDIIIPEEINGIPVTKIGDNAFKSASLNSIELPTTLISIGNSSFENNNIRYLTIPNNVERIGERAFYSSNILELNLSNSLTTLEFASFADNMIYNLVIPESVTIIEHFTFYENSISTLQFSTTLDSIGASAFMNNSLSEIILPNTVRAIDKNAFAGNKFDVFRLPFSYNDYSYTWKSKDKNGNDINNSNIVSYSSVSVQNSYLINEPIERVFPIHYHLDGGKSTNPLSYLGSDKNLILEPAYKKGFDFLGWYTDEEFQNEISLIETNKGGAITLYAKFIDRGPYILTIEDVVFSNGVIEQYINQDEINIIIPNSFKGVNVSVIDFEAFKDMQLSKVILPSKLKKIESKAFKNNNLTELIIPDEVTYIGPSSFDGNEIEDLHLGESVITIMSQAFNQNNLTSLIIPNSVQEIGPNAFHSNKLQSLSLGNSVSQLSLQAFGNNKLTNIILPTSLTGIHCAFIGNELTNIILPPHHQGYSYTWTFNGIDGINTYNSGDTLKQCVYAYLDKQLYPVYTITYHNTLDSTSNPQFYHENSQFNLAPVTKDNYIFRGWFTDSNFTEEIKSIEKGTTGDIELHAKFVVDVMTNLIHEKNILKFHPNPVTSFINVTPNGLTSIYGLDGALKFTSEQSKIDVSSLATGVYIIKQGNNTAKFIKK